MKYKLFLNETEGPAFVLMKKLERGKIETKWFNSSDNLDEFQKHSVRSTPILIQLDNGEECGRLETTDEIFTFLNDVLHKKDSKGSKK